MTATLLGIDCGTSLIKACLFDTAGTALAVAHARLDGVTPQPGHMEYRSDDLWAAAAAAIRQVLASSAVDPKTIAGIAVTGAGNGVLLVGENDRPVRNGIFALDQRAAGEPGPIAQTRPINGQGAWAGQTVQLLQWLQRHEPAAIAATRRVLVIKDYVKYRLSGAYVGDPSEISKLGLLDLRWGEISRDLLDLYGVAHLHPYMPPVRPCCERIGAVTPAAATATGLVAGTPVVNGLADLDAAAVGGGVLSAGQISVVAGTWSINQLLVDQPVIDPALFGVSCYATEGLFEQLEASASSTTNLTWFVDQCCGDLKAEAQAAKESVYTRIDRLVEGITPASGEVFFHPYLYGSNTVPTARAGFYGLGGWQKRADLLAALYEGVVFSHAVHIARLRRLNPKATEVRLSGGAAKSRVWSQQFADVLELPVAIPAAAEIGALGAAMCAAVGVGLHGSLADAAAHMVRTARIHRPDPALRAAYRSRFAAFNRITELMQPVWTELAQFAQHRTEG